MKFMNQDRIYGSRIQEEAGEGEGGSGEGEGEAESGEAQGGSGEESSEQILAKLAKYEAENQRLQTKLEETNRHSKRIQREAEKEAKRKAEAEGNYEQLFKSSEEERKQLEQELESLRNMTAKEKVNNEAMRLASSLAEGANAEILSEFIARRLTYTDEGIKVTDESGNLTVSGLNDLAKEFAGSARFSALIKGPQSSGGSATGGASSGSATKTMSRAEFDRLDPIAKHKFLREDKGQITDE